MLTENNSSKGDVIYVDEYAQLLDPVISTLWEYATQHTPINSDEYRIRQIALDILNTLFRQGMIEEDILYDYGDMPIKLLLRLPDTYDKDIAYIKGIYYKVVYPVNREITLWCHWLNKMPSEDIYLHGIHHGLVKLGACYYASRWCYRTYPDLRYIFNIPKKIIGRKYIQHLHLVTHRDMIHRLPHDDPDDVIGCILSSLNILYHLTCNMELQRYRFRNISRDSYQVMNVYNRFTTDLMRWVNVISFR